jgi:hypothetical protein
MREFKFFRKNKPLTGNIAVITARYSTFNQFEIDNHGPNFERIRSGVFKNNGVTYYIVNKDRHFRGYRFDSYIELHDSHEIPNYGEFMVCLQPCISNERI